MNPEEPNLLTHLNDVRQTLGDGEGISTVIICVKLRQESDCVAALELHRKIVEEEVNNENIVIKEDSPSPITGIVMAQVYIDVSLISISTFSLQYQLFH